MYKKIVLEGGFIMAGITIDISKSLMRWIESKININVVKKETAENFHKWIKERRNLHLVKLRR